MSYPDELNQIVFKYRAQGALEIAHSLDLNPDGSLTELGARQLHEALCREKQMTADQIIADWNQRSPRDKW
jgi:hypothetical protein